MTDRKIKRGDLAPPLEITVTDNDVPIDLTAATTVKVIGVSDGVTVINRAATSVDENGNAILQFLPADTDKARVLDIEVEIMWPGNRPQSVRTSNRLIVEPDLG